ncbi:hypothetical protein RS130_00930 [Paraglaciecola aquimarina]|uniref:Solute-binding protein family 3/N-terminal domain-containing protein n=1 Tax=Paraglaciecola aquimarina TaxID=1235557 RepID=A0ABU3SRN4_9ALTE|nr:hypothetical protein [Paraglaciecola aquimarina]MDU0352667.1 hypothetical protein [Paraglaciecola aquimarina]
MRKLIIVFILFWHFPVNAEKYIVASQNFNYYPHYNFKSSTHKGLIHTILQEFSAFSGHQFEYRPMPVLRLQRELEKGRIDLIYPDNPLFNNQDIFAKGKYYSHTIVRTIGGTMVNKADLRKDAANIKRLGVLWVLHHN